MFIRWAVFLLLVNHFCVVSLATTYYAQAYRHRHKHKQKPVQTVKRPVPVPFRYPISYSVSCQQCSYSKYLPWSTGTYSHGFIHKPIGASLQHNIQLKAEDMSQIFYARGVLESTPKSEIFTSRYSAMYVYGNFTMDGYEIPWIKNEIHVKDHSKAWFQGAFTFRSQFHLHESDFSNLRIQTTEGFIGSDANFTISRHSSVLIKPVRRSNAAKKVPLTSHALSSSSTSTKFVGLGGTKTSYNDFSPLPPPGDTISSPDSSGNLPDGGGTSGLPTLCLIQHNTLVVSDYSQLSAHGLFVMDERSNLKVSHHSQLRMDRQADLILLQDASLDVDGYARFKVKRNTRLVVAPSINFKTPSRSFIAIGGDMYCAIIAPIEDRYYRGAEIFIGNEVDSNRYRFIICRPRSKPKSMEHALQWYLRHNPTTIAEVSAALLQN